MARDLRSSRQRSNPEARMVESTVSEIADEYDHEYWRSCADNDQFTDELWDALAEAGFHGIVIPEEYNGVKMGIQELSTLIRTLAEHGVEDRLYMSTCIMSAIPIVHHGSAELKERFLPKIAAGDCKIAFGLTEPEAGTNSFAISTRAELEGDEYVINGQKLWTSGAKEADYILLVTRTTPYEKVRAEDPGDGGTLLLVPTDADGVEMERLDVSMTETIGEYTVHFDDVHVPVENRIGKEDDGFRHMFDALNPERITLASLVIGYGNFVLERAVDYAANREVFDAPIGSYQGIQHPLSEAKIALELSELATQEAIEAFEADREDAGIWANMASYASSEAADEAFDIALQAHGGNGFSRDYDIITLQNNIRLYRIAPINNEMLLNYVGRRVLDLPKSY